MSRKPSSPPFSPTSYLDGLRARIEAARPRPDDQSLPLYDWALAYRIINGQPFTITHALRALYESTHPRIIVRKAAQVFVSEWLVNAALWVPDTRAGGRGNALYVFPKAEQGDDFSQARIDKAIGESPHLTARLGQPAKVRLKQIGPGYLYLRGAQNRDQLISVDADVALCDEIAQYGAGTIDLITKRLGSSQLAWIRAGSTPRYPSDEAGQVWDQSTQQVYEIRCSHCGVWQHLELGTHLNPETAAVECPRCGGDLAADRLSEGRWAAQAPGREWEGYQLTKLLSPRANLADLARVYRKVLEGRATATETQEFYNSDAGVPHLPAGGHISADQLDACRDPDYRMPGSGDDMVMGADIGKRHYAVVYRRDGERLRLVHAESVRTWEELDALMPRYGVRRCVVDANPETHEAQKFAERWRGRVWLAYYPNFADSQHSELCVWDDEKGVVRINRTAALDAVLARVAGGRLILPANARELGGAVDKAGAGEYYRHLGAPIRVVQDDARGNPTPRYEQNGADHFAHASAYAEVAASRTERDLQIFI